VISAQCELIDCAIFLRSNKGCGANLAVPLNVPIEFALNFFAAKERMPLVLLAERENEAGKSGLFYLRSA
jgi:hypothetical protein